MAKRLLLLIFALWILSFGAIAEKPAGNFLQDEINTPEPPLARWIYGISIGLYVPDNNTALYYKGAGPEHSVERALNLQFNRDRLIREIDDIIASFSLYELPGKMRYNPALLLGFYAALEFNGVFALTGEFSYTRLQTAGKFTIQTDKETFTSEPFLILSDISGTEERIDLRLGVQYTLHTRGYMHPYLESGISLTDTKVLNNRINVRGININIRNMYDEYYQVRDYGIGFGFYSGLGLKMDVNEQFSLRTGASVAFLSINLGDNNEIKPQFSFFVRLNLNQVFAQSAL